MRQTTRVMTLSAAALALVTLATGCSTQTEGKTLDAVTARDRMTELVQQTMRAAGGDWTALSDGPAATPCSTSDGSDGVTFSWDQERTGSEDPKALVAAVAAVWKSGGYEVSFRDDTIDDGRPLYTAVTLGRAVDSISVNASARRVSIEVQSKCGSGDVRDYE
jgi:hypothetical protein